MQRDCFHCKEAMDAATNFCTNCGELLGSRPAATGQKVGGLATLGTGLLLYFVGLRTIAAMSRFGDTASPRLFIMALLGMIAAAVGGLMLGRSYRKSVIVSIAAVVAVCALIAIWIGPIFIGWGAHWGRRC